MILTRLRAGLSPRVASPPPAATIEAVVTEEAGFEVRDGRRGPKLLMEAGEGDVVARGAPVARLIDAPEVAIVAAMPARIGRIVHSRGHRLSEIVLFHEQGGEVQQHDTRRSDSANGLRALLQEAGAWPWFRRRPFGGIPGPTEMPRAVFVMACDTRPLSADPRAALTGREEALLRGLHALTRLVEAPVYFCQSGTAPIISGAPKNVRLVVTGQRHPQGLAGIQAHDLCPAGLDAPVWDIHAEEVSNIGDLLKDGVLPLERVVRVAGPALREERLVRTQPGADLRGLIRRIVKPGTHSILSGSPLDGHPAHWLGPRDRQATVMPRLDAQKASHWLIDALTKSASPAPVIPTSALDQAFAGTLAAPAFLRALASGDDEAAIDFGVLSFLEEDMALADYVLGREDDLPALLRAMLERIRRELAA